MGIQSLPLLPRVVEIIKRIYEDINSNKSSLVLHKKKKNDRNFQLGEINFYIFSFVTISFFSESLERVQAVIDPNKVQETSGCSIEGSIVLYNPTFRGNILEIPTHTVHLSV